MANIKRHDYMLFGEEIGLIGVRTGLKGFMNDGTWQKFTGYEPDRETGLLRYGSDFAESYLAHAAIEITCYGASNRVTPKYVKP